MDVDDGLDVRGCIFLGLHRSLDIGRMAKPMKVGGSVKIPNAICTACKRLIDGASCIGEEAVPSPGDFTICIYCGHLMAYGEAQQLRELTDAEMLRVAGDRRIVATQRARQAFWKEEK